MFSVASTHDSEEILTDLCVPYRSPNIRYGDCGFYFTKDGYTLTCRDRRKTDDVEEIINKYLEILSKTRKIDFELMLFYAYELVSANASIAKLLSGMFPIILIDEYQDTKEIQYSIVSRILAAGSGKLVSRLPEYEFDGPGMVPFARDTDNFWFKLSRIALTSASPAMYVRRLRWAREILVDLDAAGVSVSRLKPKSLLRETNSVVLTETDGLTYLQLYFENFFSRIEIDFTVFPALADQYVSFFSSSAARIEKLRKEGAEFISDISAFRRVFKDRSGITISTIHGVKGDEFDTVISYGLLEGKRTTALNT